jgi:hypothetical protein
MVKVFKEKIHDMSLSFCISSYIEFDNKFGMWINIKFFIWWCFSPMTNPYFSTSKVHYY